ncbi:MAG: YHS domain-containing (seleno)protein [Limnothrix sp.]
MKISSLTTLSLGVLLSFGAIAGFNHVVDSRPAPAQEITATKADRTIRANKLSLNNTRFINKRNGVAIKGTDPVAYFTQGKPVRGSASFTHSWNGATWHFSSAANRNLFAANPTKYAPQYGGYCAWAISQGSTADIDPNAWKIVDGKLYLNLNRNIQNRWERDIPGFISKANLNWPRISGS